VRAGGRREPTGGPVTGERLDEAALALGAEAVALAADVSAWLRCRRRSRIAVAITGSANTVPRSATLRFDVISMALGINESHIACIADIYGKNT